jgi:flagellar protein FlbD
MIRLHKLNGVDVVINAELIESVEVHGAETMLTMVTGNKLVVKESIPELVEKTMEYKKKVFVGAAYVPEFLRGPEGGK